MLNISRKSVITKAKNIIGDKEKAKMMEKWKEKPRREERGGGKEKIVRQYRMIFDFLLLAMENVDFLLRTS